MSQQCNVILHNLSRYIILLCKSTPIIYLYYNNLIKNVNVIIIYKFTPRTCIHILNNAAL